MQCKKALEEAAGDMEKAQEALLKASSGIAAKKAGRNLGAGVVAAYTHAGGLTASGVARAGSVVGAVVLACETDFVAKNEEFSKLAYDISMHVAAMNPHCINGDEEGHENCTKEDALLEQSFIKDPGKTVRVLIEEAIQKFGEKIEITRFERLVA